MLILNVFATHTVASWLLKTIDGFLDDIGLRHHQIIEAVIYLAIITLFSLGIGICLKKLILYITNRVLAKRQSVMAQELRNRNVLLKCSHIIPPLVFLAMVPFAFSRHSPQLVWIMRLAGVYTLIAFAGGMSSILEFIFDRYNVRENRKNLPLKGVLNVAIGIVWIIIIILSICILINKSPATLLAGLGAFAAALMLIFKDSILGFVAGIQMSDNDMLRVGDWIVVPGTPANGIVQDVSLSTVKILNWNLSTVMVPPYTLVSTSFQNYRSMYDYNQRLIENAAIIDMTSVCTIDADTVDKIVGKYPLLKDFVANLRKDSSLIQSDPGVTTPNGSIATNLGLFRAYLSLFLNNHPKISKQQNIIVRLMQGTDTGMALQLWCFTATSNWVEYEAVQSAVFEHIASSAPDFAGLRVYSGNNIGVRSSAGFNDEDTLQKQKLFMQNIQGTPLQGTPQSHSAKPQAATSQDSAPGALVDSHPQASNQ